MGKVYVTLRILRAVVDFAVELAEKRDQKKSDAVQSYAAGRSAYDAAANARKEKPCPK